MWGSGRFKQHHNFIVMDARQLLTFSIGALHISMLCVDNVFPLKHFVSTIIMLVTLLVKCFKHFLILNCTPCQNVSKYPLPCGLTGPIICLLFNHDGGLLASGGKVLPIINCGLLKAHTRWLWNCLYLAHLVSKVQGSSWGPWSKMVPDHLSHLAQGKSKGDFRTGFIVIFCQNCTNVKNMI